MAAKHSVCTILVLFLHLHLNSLVALDFDVLSSNSTVWSMKEILKLCESRPLLEQVALLTEKEY